MSINQREDEQVIEESSISVQGLDSFIQDSVSPLHEIDKGPEIPNVQAHTSETQQQEIDRNIVLLNSPMVIDSNCNIRASQLEGINLQVELNPISARKAIKSQIYEECMSTRGAEYEDEEYVSDTLEHEEELIEEELQSTLEAGNILGIEYVDIYTDIRRMKKLIQNEVNQLKLLKKINSFAPLQRH
ncbi:hypothetical protein RHGRI_013259 [Rhododendron griersonianum]|uniref:Uncharacterized protein n=1 Tax=Rhododendron griersonianum TaxID=479676 RepID=A0AAV6K569_9ERIC|nr:hypothetical protein RHGRI_013259 [Rhododendron griersonianum]